MDRSPGVQLATIQELARYWVVGDTNPAAGGASCGGLALAARVL